LPRGGAGLDRLPLLTPTTSVRSSGRRSPGGTR
jgi:hypothetical protein